MIWLRPGARNRARGKAGTLPDGGGCGNCAIMPAHRLSLLFRPLHQPAVIMIQRPPRSAVVLGLAPRVLASSLSACRKKEAPAPPMATPSVRLNHDRTPLGSPVDITYKFVVANDAKFTEDLRVMVHVVDADEELIFAFDHNPAVPTTQWKPGQTVEYTKTVFVPIYPYVGEATIQVGLHSTTTQKRVTLAGDDAGQHAYNIAKIQLHPQTENVFTVFKDGWHPGEIAEQNVTDGC